MNDKKLLELKQRRLEILKQKAKLEAKTSLVKHYKTYLSNIDEYVEPASFHYEISDILLNRQGHFAIEAFRGSAKTSYVLEDFPVYCLQFPQTIRSYIIIIKQNQTLAEQKLKEIANNYLYHKELNTNLVKINIQSAKIFECIVKDDTGKQIIVRMEAYGKGSALRGLNYNARRPDIVIIDDPQDFEDSRSDVTLEKDWDWFLSDVKPLGKNTRIFIIGNNLGQKCLIEKIFIHKLELNFTSMIIPAVDEQGKPTWEEQFNLEFLNQERESYTKTGKIDIWYRERLCKCISPDSQIFKKEDFQYFTDADLQGKQLQYYTTVDLAISQKQDADESVILTVARETGNPNWYIVDIVNGKLTPHEVIEALFQTYAKYRQSVIGIESVAYQKALLYFIEEEMRRRRIYLPLSEIKSTKNKEIRIKGLQPLYKTGVIYHRHNQSQLEEQLLTFPNGAHDDLLDCLAFQLEIAEITKNVSNNDTIRRWTMGKNKGLSGIL